MGLGACDALLAGKVERRAAIAQVRSLLGSRHHLGIAHCDVCLENVFVLDSGVAILGHLEYVRRQVGHLQVIFAGVTVANSLCRRQVVN